MYNYHQLPVSPVLVDEPAQLPIRALLAIPDYSAESAGIFNLPGAVDDLVGRSGWERAITVLDPKVWSPGWGEARLQTFVENMIPGRQFPPVSLSSLRVYDFLGSAAESPRYDLVHFCGQVEDRAGDPVLKIGADENAVLTPGALRDMLVRARTRLLILQSSTWASDAARRMGHLVAGSGGPAVLCVGAVLRERPLTEDEERLLALHLEQYIRDRWSVPPPELFRTYFLDFYAEVLHNKQLQTAAAPRQVGIANDLEIDLYLGDRGEDLLRLDSWMNALNERMKSAQAKIISQSVELGALRSRVTRRVHVTRAQPFIEDIAVEEATMGELQVRLDGLASRLSGVQGRLWGHESDGVSLAEVAAEFDRIELEASDKTARARDELVALEKEEQDEAARAPRVLNANFHDPATEHWLAAREAMIAGREYDLKVDIGPRWDKIPSIVTGNSGFPEEALPPGKDGWVIRVVFVSDDFTPRLASAEVWLPTQSGRSFPIVDEKRPQKAGPVALRVTAPAFPSASDAQIITARGRLMLYYENNLLQSAIVQAGVTRAGGVALDEDNKVQVDFVLSGSFQGIQDRFTRRAVKFIEGEEIASYPVAVNLTLNDDGKGGHRLVVSGNANLPPFWIPYDSVAMKDLLKQARDLLSDCCDGLNPNMGKKRDLFKKDLHTLAVFGRNLFDLAFQEVELEGSEDARKLIGATRAKWKRAFREAVKESAIIQITRLGHDQYVFPWSLVYDITLEPGVAWTDCPVIDAEWSAEGFRDKPMQKSCPYQGPNGHPPNTICPYGFWGVRHVIEQPPSVVGGLGEHDAETQIILPATFDLAVGVTRDPNLKKGIEAHLGNLRQIPSLRFVPAQEANDLDGARDMLRAPTVAYFLCHGEYDDQNNKPFLNLGSPEAPASPKIYVDTLDAWAEQPLPQGLDLDAWEKKHPLIFINGCHTSELKPGQIANFVSAFANLGASGVLGTEVSVRLPVATLVAESLFRQLAQLTGEPATLGTAIRRIRWELLNKGNLGGLAYTLYCLSNLRLVRTN